MAQDTSVNTPKPFSRARNLGTPNSVPRECPNLPSLHTSNFKPRNIPTSNLISENKVMVYGFSTQSEKEGVIKRFRNLGTIESFDDRSGNWISITYSSKAEAQKALSMDGQILLDRVMIGVKPSYMDETASYEFLLENAPIFQTDNSTQSIPRRYLSFWENLRLYFFNLD